MAAGRRPEQPGRLERAGSVGGHPASRSPGGQLRSHRAEVTGPDGLRRASVPHLGHNRGFALLGGDSKSFLKERRGQRDFFRIKNIKCPCLGFVQNTRPRILFETARGLHHRVKRTMLVLSHFVVKDHGTLSISDALERKQKKSFNKLGTA